MVSRDRVISLYINEIDSIASVDGKPPQPC